MSAHSSHDSHADMTHPPVNAQSPAAEAVTLIITGTKGTRSIKGMTSTPVTA
jgi:hypothetical protein